MRITKKDIFFDSLDNILDYIFKDSIQRGFKFSADLDMQINKLNFMPYKFRKSIYFDNEKIRDLIFKGYVIPYEINEKKKEIIILDILKYKKV